MPLLGGFNPETGTFENIKPVIDIPRNTYSHSSNATFRRRRSIFSRFNEGVSDVGNWFADNADSVFEWMYRITVGLLILTGVVSVIVVLVDDGFWAAILTAIVIFILVAISCTVASIVVKIAVNIVMYAFRFIFWNGWTLLMAIALLIGGWAYTAFSSPSYDYTSVDKTEVAAPHYERYRCTAKVLNVRIQPNKTGRVVGTLRKGQEVEVINLYNDFAEIDYNGSKCYVSQKYLQKIN